MKLVRLIFAYEHLKKLTTFLTFFSVVVSHKGIQSLQLCFPKIVQIAVLIVLNQSKTLTGLFSVFQDPALAAP